MSQGESEPTHDPSSTPLDGSSPPAKGSVRLSTIDRIAVPIVATVLAFVATLVAANISNSGAAENRRTQLEEQRRKDDKDRRFEIYITYLDAVGAFATPFRQMIGCLREKPSTAAAIR